MRLTNDSDTGFRFWTNLELWYEKKAGKVWLSVGICGHDMKREEDTPIGELVFEVDPRIGHFLLEMMETKAGCQEVLKALQVSSSIETIGLQTFTTKNDWKVFNDGRDGLRLRSIVNMHQLELKKRRAAHKTFTSIYRHTIRGLYQFLILKGYDVDYHVPSTRCYWSYGIENMSGLHPSQSLYLFSIRSIMWMSDFKKKGDRIISFAEIGRTMDAVTGEKKENWLL